MSLAQLGVDLPLGHQVARRLLDGARVLDVEPGEFALEYGQLVVNRVWPRHDVVLRHAFDRAEAPYPTPDERAADRAPVLLAAEGRLDAGPAVFLLGQVVERDAGFVPRITEDL